MLWLCKSCHTHTTHTLAHTLRCVFQLAVVIFLLFSPFFSQLLALFSFSLACFFLSLLCFLYFILIKNCGTGVHFFARPLPLLVSVSVFFSYSAAAKLATFRCASQSSMGLSVCVCVQVFVCLRVCFALYIGSFVLTKVLKCLQVRPWPNLQDVPGRFLKAEP